MLKRGPMSSPQSFCCHGSGDSMATCTPTYTTALAQECKPLELRDSPPLSLDDVPHEYIVVQLRNLAPFYWNKPETADCTIIVPIPHAQGKPLHPSIAEQLPPQTNASVSSMYDPSGLGRRATEPTLDFVPRLRLKLHIDYLSTHSSYIRALLSGANPADLIHTTPGFDHQHPIHVPANRLPHLISSSTTHPVLVLPVPDPSSFHLLVHWMYFGDTTYISECLRQGVIHWEGIARNVEYLGLSAELKLFLYRWYFREKSGVATSDDDSDTVFSDSDDDDYDCSTISVMDSSYAHSDDDSDDDAKEPFRGRPRRRRPLSYQEPGTRSWHS